MSNTIVTSAGLSGAISAGSDGLTGPYFPIKYFLLVYDPRIDPNIHGDGVTEISAFADTVNVNDVSPIQTGGHIIFNVPSGTYELSKESILLSAGTEIIVGDKITNSPYSALTKVNTYNGVPLLNVVTATPLPVGTDVGEWDFSGITTSGAVSRTTETDGLIVDRQFYFPIESYTPISSGDGGMLRGLFKCRVGNDVGNFKFNKVALFVTSYAYPGPTEIGQPILIGMACLNSPVYKEKDGFNITNLEIDVEMQFNATTATFDAVVYKTNDYWVKVPATSGYGLYADQDIAIGSSGTGWLPQAKLSITDPEKAQLRLASDYDSVYFDFKVKKVGEYEDHQAVAIYRTTGNDLFLIDNDGVGYFKQGIYLSDTYTPNALGTNVRFKVSIDKDIIYGALFDSTETRANACILNFYELPNISGNNKEESAIYIIDRTGTSATQYGLRATLRASTSGDNYGIYSEVKNPGNGNAVAGYFEASGTNALAIYAAQLCNLDSGLISGSYFELINTGLSQFNYNIYSYIQARGGYGIYSYADGNGGSMMGIRVRITSGGATNTGIYIEPTFGTSSKNTYGLYVNATGKKATSDNYNYGAYIEGVGSDYTDPEAGGAKHAALHTKVDSTTNPGAYNVGIYNFTSKANGDLATKNFGIMSNVQYGTKSYGIYSLVSNNTFQIAGVFKAEASTYASTENNIGISAYAKTLAEQSNNTGIVITTQETAIHQNHIGLYIEHLTNEAYDYNNRVWGIFINGSSIENDGVNRCEGGIFIAHNGENQYNPYSLSSPASVGIYISGHGNSTYSLGQYIKEMKENIDDGAINMGLKVCAGQKRNNFGIYSIATSTFGVSNNYGIVVDVINTSGTTTGKSIGIYSKVLSNNTNTSATYSGLFENADLAVSGANMVIYGSSDKDSGKQIHYPHRNPPDEIAEGGNGYQYELHTKSFCISGNKIGCILSGTDLNGVYGFGVEAWLHVYGESGSVWHAFGTIVCNTASILHELYFVKDYDSNSHISCLANGGNESDYLDYNSPLLAYEYDDGGSSLWITNVGEDIPYILNIKLTYIYNGVTITTMSSKRSPIGALVD